MIVVQEVFLGCSMFINTVRFHGFLYCHPKGSPGSSNYLQLLTVRPYNSGTRIFFLNSNSDKDCNKAQVVGQMHTGEIYDTTLKLLINKRPCSKFIK